MPWSKEKRAAHMRAKRAAGKPNPHEACDRRIAELEAVIAAQNEEIGMLKHDLAAFSDEMTEDGAASLDELLR